MVAKRVLALVAVNLLLVSPVCNLAQRKDQSEHTDMAMSLAFSPDSATLLATRDHDLVLWDVETARTLRTFVGHPSVVTSAAFSPDGKMAISASNDGAIKVWSIPAARQILSLAQGLSGRVRYDKEVNAVAFSPDGRFVLSGGNDGYLNVWEVASGRLLHSLHELLSPSIRCLAFGPGFKTVFVGSGDGTIRLWDLDKRRVIRTFVHNRVSFLDSLSVSSNGTRLLSVCLDSVKLWDVETGKEVRTFNELGKEYYTPTRVVFSPDGHRAFVGDDGRVFVWDIDTGQRLRTLVSDELSHVESLAVSPNGKYVIAGDIWGHIKRWQIGTGTEGVAFVPKSDADDGVRYK